MANKLYIGIRKITNDDALKRNTQLNNIEQYIYLKRDSWYVDVVNGKLLNELGITENEAWHTAQENTFKETEIFPLGSMFGVENEDSPVWIVTNTARAYGASAILNMDALRQKGFNGTYYMLPSSIHEVLLIKKTPDIRKEDLDAMVRDVNAGFVREEDILGDRAYVMHIEGKGRELIHMAKQYKRNENGKWTQITPVRQEGNMLTARVHGVEMTLDVSDCKHQSEMVARFYAEYERTKGDNTPMTREETVKLARKLANERRYNHGFDGRKIVVNGHSVRKVRILKGSGGTSIAKGYVAAPQEKEVEIEVAYSASCMSKYGSRTAKPWLRQAREDLVEEYIRRFEGGTQKRKLNLPGPRLVDDVFVARLRESGFDAKVIDGNVYIDLGMGVDTSFAVGDTQLKAIGDIANGLEKYAKKQEEEEKEIERFFSTFAVA